MGQTMEEGSRGGRAVILFGMKCCCSVPEVFFGLREHYLSVTPFLDLCFLALCFLLQPCLQLFECSKTVRDFVLLNFLHLGVSKGGGVNIYVIGWNENIRWIGRSSYV